MPLCVAPPEGEIGGRGRHQRSLHMHVSRVDRRNAKIVKER